jgi:hypothetical protein
MMLKLIVFFFVQYILLFDVYVIFLRPAPAQLLHVIFVGEAQSTLVKILVIKLLLEFEFEFEFTPS